MKNRTIIFRAWSNIFGENEMFFDVEMHIKEDGQWWHFNENKRLYQSGDRCAIMQFVEVEDKEGTDIYDGDILSELVECDGKMVESNQPVFYNVKAFAWCIDISFNKDRSSFEFLHEINLMNYRVVGNIHQDSDLLKTK